MKNQNKETNESLFTAQCLLGIACVVAFPVCVVYNLYNIVSLITRLFH